MPTSRRDRLMGRQENCRRILFTLLRTWDENNQVSFAFCSGTPYSSSASLWSLCIQSTSLRMMLALDFVSFSTLAIAHYSELHCFPLVVVVDVVLIITRSDCVLERRRREKKHTRFLCSLCKCVRRERKRKRTQHSNFPLAFRTSVCAGARALCLEVNGEEERAKRNENRLVRNGDADA